MKYALALAALTIGAYIIGTMLPVGIQVLFGHDESWQMLTRIAIGGALITTVIISGILITYLIQNVD